MDSLTQIVLGAAVGEAVCGRKEGNKAMFWGAVAGTIPDLDVLARPFQDIVQELVWHRSITHSMLFAVLVAPLCGYLLHLLYQKLRKNNPPPEAASFRDWTVLFFLGFVTHWLLDCFTTWGTQVFFPFSDMAIAWKSIFVVDPFYTLPFLLFLILAAFQKRNRPKRQLFNRIGLVVSSLYLALTLSNKYQVNQVFEEALQKQGIVYQDYDSRPTPLNNILWAVNVKTAQGFYIGYYSFLDKNKDIEFFFFEQQKDLLGKLENHPKVQTLLEITQGYYTVRKKDENTLIINDLRFGQLDGWQDGKGDFVFVYQIKKEEGKLHFTRAENKLQTGRKMLGQFANRVFGKD